MVNEMIVFGTGDAICMHYKNTFFALTDGEKYFVVDGGGGHEALLAIQQNCIDWENIRTAFLSHAHTDHLLGMVWIIRYITEMMEWGTYLGNFDLYTHDVAADKLFAICRLLLKPALQPHLENRINIHLVEEGDTAEVLGARLSFFDLRSVKEKQFGFTMVDPRAGKFVFSGDETPYKVPVEYIEDADWLCLESYCLARDEEILTPHEYCHNTVPESAEFAEKLRVRNLILYHTEDSMSFGHKKELYIPEAKERFSGTVYAPVDNDRILLSCEGS